MILKHIRIENLRSYVDETITFPEGSLLLAGDIGSGKSSILLCIEFALFGIMKGDVSGLHLLRHGAKEGSVTLTMEIGKREVTIKRSLKRGSNAIQQEAGYIMINGRKTDLVAKELKARMLQLLGYSESMLNKSKSLIYRYTVYTPQEDMKRIILSGPEERLNTLRSVFGIDKYKTIRENISLCSREIKRNISYLQGQVIDLDEIKTGLEETKKLKQNIEESIKTEAKKVEKRKNELHSLTEMIAKKEDDIEKIRTAKSSIRLLESKIENTLRNIKTYEDKIAVDKERIKQLESETSESRKVNEEKLLQRISDIKKEILAKRTEITELTRKIGQYEYKKSESQEITKKISSLTRCAVCLQEVQGSHKHRIIEDNQKKIDESEKTIGELRKEKLLIDETISSFEKKLEEYRTIQKKSDVTKLKLASLEEKKKEVEDSVKKIHEQKGVHEKLKLDKLSLEKEIKGSEAIEKSYVSLRQDLLKMQSEGKSEEIRLARLNEQHNAVSEAIEKITAQIHSKESTKEKIKKLSETHEWLTEFLDNLMITMEKHVFAKIYHEFNDLVSRWFSQLIGDETILLKLNNEFTPILEQNGYETGIENLSGGEKTAVALSYRLALNKVINDVISNINTKDLIILDEPTDGFSSEQLDRVKEVIEELDLKQVIIVSHESKVEGFVDSVIRVVKHNHESKVIV